MTQELLPQLVVTEHPFLSLTACASLLTILDRHPQLALDRNPKLPGTFVTYGRATYLDVCLPRAEPERDYYGLVAATNRGLVAMFGPLYDELRLFVERLLAEPVGYEPDLLALPGVHIFRGAGIRSAAEAGAHFDVQYQKLRLPAPPDPELPPLSITVPLRMPAHGTGIQVYDVTYSDYERAYRMGRISSLDELVRRKSSAYYPYAVGRLVLHRGLVVHCISSPGPVAPDDERITLQCHGIRCQGKWVLYW
jgi:hypothetical protein